MLETDPGDPNFSHFWDDIALCLAKFKFLQDQANSLLSKSGYSAPNIPSDRFNARDYAYIRLYYRKNSLGSFTWGGAYGSLKLFNDSVYCR